MTKAKTTRAPRQSTVDPNESAAAKFKRLATKRTGKAIRAISAVGKLTGRSYERTEADAKKITDALESAVTDVKTAFAGKAKAVSGFSL